MTRIHFLYFFNFVYSSLSSVVNGIVDFSIRLIILFMDYFLLFFDQLLNPRPGITFKLFTHLISFFFLNTRSTSVLFNQPPYNLLTTDRTIKKFRVYSEETRKGNLYRDHGPFTSHNNPCLDRFTFPRRVIARLLSVMINYYSFSVYPR